MMCRLRLALSFCCGCMLSLIFIFTWHPLKEKIPGEKVSRGLLSWDCEKLFQFIPKGKLLLSTGVGWRKVVDVDGCWMKSPGGIKFRLFRWCWWLNFFWATVKVEYLHLDIADDIANISSSFPESYASSPRSELWPVMFFISHFGNPKDFNFRTVVFLAEWFVIFLFTHNSVNGYFFSFCSILRLFCSPPWIDFYTKHQLEEHQ